MASSHRMDPLPNTLKLTCSARIGGIRGKSCSRKSRVPPMQSMRFSAALGRIGIGMASHRASPSPESRAEPDAAQERLPKTNSVIWTTNKASAASEAPEPSLANPTRHFYVAHYQMAFGNPYEGPSTRCGPDALQYSSPRGKRDKRGNKVTGSPAPTSAISRQQSLPHREGAERTNQRYPVEDSQDGQGG